MNVTGNAKVNNENRVIPQKLDSASLEVSTFLLTDIRQLIEEARAHVAREYNSTQVLLCWLIGNRINETILKYERAEYGEAIVILLAKELSLLYGRGYSRPNIFKMIKFVRFFPSRQIVSTLSRQLSWSHFILLSGIEEVLKRDFYAEMCRVQRWSVRGLKKQIDGMLYERTALSKQPEIVIQAVRNEDYKVGETRRIVHPALQSAGGLY